MADYIKQENGLLMIANIGSGGGGEGGVTENNYFAGANKFPSEDEEIVIGCASNGKPIYRKMFSSYIVLHTDEVTNMGKARMDIDEVIDLHADITASDGMLYPVSLLGGDGKYLNVYSDSNSIYFKSSLEGTIYSPIFDYTKVSDTENSFKPNMLSNYVSVSGGYYEDYSEDEIVVGKWLDGKPLYRKVFKGLKTNSSTTETVLIDKNEFSIGLIIKIDGWCVYGNKIDLYGTRPIHFAYGTTFDIWDSSNSIKEKHSSSDFNSSELTLILEYTKTTDEPNSFDPSMIISQATVDVATDEEVEEVFG